MDDILCVNDDPDDVLNKLSGYVQFKPSSGGSPGMYLTTKVTLMQLHDVRWAWSMSSSTNFKGQSESAYVAKHLSKCYRLSMKEENPISMGYYPELDESQYWE